MQTKEKNRNRKYITKDRHVIHDDVELTKRQKGGPERPISIKQTGKGMSKTTDKLLRGSPSEAVSYIRGMPAIKLGYDLCRLATFAITLNYYSYTQRFFPSSSCHCTKSVLTTSAPDIWRSQQIGSKDRKCIGSEYFINYLWSISTLGQWLICQFPTSFATLKSGSRKWPRFHKSMLKAGRTINDRSNWSHLQAPYASDATVFKMILNYRKFCMMFEMTLN